MTDDPTGAGHVIVCYSNTPTRSDSRQACHGTGADERRETSP